LETGKNGMRCRVFTGEGQVAMVMGRNCREATVKEGTVVRISPFLVIAFIAPAGALPVIENDCAVFPAGFRLWYIPVEDMERAIRIGKAKKMDQPSIMEVHTLFPHQ